MIIDLAVHIKILHVFFVSPCISRILTRRRRSSGEGGLFAVSATYGLGLDLMSGDVSGIRRHYCCPRGTVLQRLRIPVARDAGALPCAPRLRRGAKHITLSRRVISARWMTGAVRRNVIRFCSSHQRKATCSRR